MAKHDDATMLLEHGVHIPTRTVHLNGEVNADFAERAVRGLRLLDSLSHAPITVLLDTPGGDEQDGMAAFDAIRACHSHVTVIGTGSVMSMGSWIIQAADHRLLTPNALMMLHYGTAEASEHTSNFARYAEQVQCWNERMEECFLARIQEKHGASYPKSKLSRLLQFDTYLDAEEAVDLGLADGIAQPHPSGGNG